MPPARQTLCVSATVGLHPCADTCQALLPYIRDRGIDSVVICLKYRATNENPACRYLNTTASVLVEKPLGNTQGQVLKFHGFVFRGEESHASNITMGLEIV